MIVELTEEEANIVHWALLGKTVENSDFMKDPTHRENYPGIYTQCEHQNKVYSTVSDKLRAAKQLTNNK